METGEEKAWATLAGLDPSDVSRRAGVVFDVAARRYCLRTFGQDALVYPQERKIVGHPPETDLLLVRFAHFSHLTILHYLIGAQNIAPTGKLVRPADTKSGHIFSRGSHVLPLNRLADKFGDGANAFQAIGRALGGEPASLADSSVRLFPLPRFPVLLLLWKKDDEFPARADLLLDSTCEAHLPADVIWSTAMLTVLMMLAP